MNKERAFHFEYYIEALRGYAAFCVLIFHVALLEEAIDPKFNDGFLRPYSPSGHSMVLLFFVLSGYVIGLNNKNPLSRNTAIPYLRKRLQRLYPIYIISLLIALLISEFQYPLSTVIGNLFFLQVSFFDVIFENSPAWSLNYEVLYYLLFIPVSLFRLNSVIVVVASVGIGLFVFFNGSPYACQILTSYLFGFAFWGSGLVIAQYFEQDKLNKISFQLLISLLFMFLSLKNFNFFYKILNKAGWLIFGCELEFLKNLGIQGWFKRAIPFLDFAFLPYCILLVLIFSEKQFKLRKWILLIMFLLPAYNLLYIFRNWHDKNYLISISGSVIFYLLSLFFYFVQTETLTKIAKKIIEAGIWLGGISYGIYIIHFPILMAFKKISFFSGSIFTWTVRLIIYILIVIGVSYLLEKKFQPWVRSKFF